MSFEKFKALYKPVVKKSTLKRLNRYLLIPKVKEEKNEAFLVYEMFVWSYIKGEGKLVNGRKIGADAYLITEEPHYVADSEEFDISDIVDPVTNN